MSKSTAVKDNTSKSAGTSKGGGLLLEEPSIEGAVNGVVPYALLTKGFRLFMPFYMQGSYYRYFFTEPGRPNIVHSDAQQAYEQDKPIICTVSPEVALKFAGHQLALHYWYQDLQILASRTVVYQMEAA
jgi:hypothetical protein